MASKATWKSLSLALHAKRSIVVRSGLIKRNAATAAASNLPLETQNEIYVCVVVALKDILLTEELIAREKLRCQLPTRRQTRRQQRWSTDTSHIWLRLMFELPR